MRHTLLFWAACFLAYANGANDNFKGVATLFGSGTTHYRGALAWATLTTLAGSGASIFLAAALVQRFSGQGLVPPDVAGSPHFLLAVALGAGLTVMLATWTGLPISTTHSLTGALVGSGLVAVRSQVNFAALGQSFFLPLLLSPLLAMLLGASVYTLFRRFRTRLGLTRAWCLCLGEPERVILALQPASMALLRGATGPEVILNREGNCAQRAHGRVLKINLQQVLDASHYLSAGLVSFARGLNDTSKIVALLVWIEALGIPWGMLAVALGMALGGLLNARKVAETMSQKITPLSHAQGFTANLVTGALVVLASRLGLPVSTTHVSVGSLFGLGLITRQANVRMISEILLAWVLTLPLAALLSGLVYGLLFLG